MLGATYFLCMIGLKKMNIYIPCRSTKKDNEGKNNPFFLDIQILSPFVNFNFIIIFIINETFYERKLAFPLFGKENMIMIYR